MSYISISTIPCNEVFVCVRECVYSPLQIQSKADLLCTSQVSQGEKVCSLVFNEKPKKRSLAYAYQAAHTVPKNKRMLLQANRPRQPNSQAPMHKKRQQLRLWWRDGAKKKPRRSPRQQEPEPETEPRSRQPACLNGNARRRTPFANCRQLTHTTHTAHPLTRSLTRTFTISTLFQEISHHLLFKVFFEKHQHATWLTDNNLCCFVDIRHSPFGAANVIIPLPTGIFIWPEFCNILKETFSTPISMLLAFKFLVT